MADRPLILLVFIGIALLVLGVKWLRLNDPENKSVIFTKEIPDVALITKGVYKVEFFRQSGNIHSDSVLLDRDSALKELLKRLDRSSITEVAVFKNNLKEFQVSRMMHEAKGKAAGKKLGSVLLTWIREEEVVENPIDLDFDLTLKHAETLLSHLKELAPLPKSIQSSSDRSILLEALGITDELKRICDSTEGLSLSEIENVQSDIKSTLDQENQGKNLNTQTEK